MTCTIIGFLVTCLHLAPLAPSEAVKKMTQPWMAPPPMGDGPTLVMAPRSTASVFDQPNVYVPAAPLAPPWSVTTEVRHGYVRTYFNGRNFDDLSDAPLHDGQGHRRR